MVVIQPFGFMKIRRVAIHQRPFRQRWKMLFDKAFSVPILERNRTTLFAYRFNAANQFFTPKPSVQLPFSRLLNTANQAPVMNNTGPVTPVQIKRAKANLELIKLPKPRLYFSLTPPLFDRQGNGADPPAKL